MVTAITSNDIIYEQSRNLAAVVSASEMVEEKWISEEVLMGVSPSAEGRDAEEANGQLW